MVTRANQITIRFAAGIVFAALLHTACENKRDVKEPSAAAPTGKADDQSEGSEGSDQASGCPDGCDDQSVCIPGPCRTACEIDAPGCCEPDECLPVCSSSDECEPGWICTPDGFCDVDSSPPACDAERPCADGLACVLEPCAPNCSVDDPGCCPDSSICLIDCTGAPEVCPTLYTCQSDGAGSVCIFGG